MAVRYLLASGNWDNASNWFAGVIPGPGDDVFTNGFNVTINVATVTVNTLQNAASVSPVTAPGGVYTISVACTLTVTGGILHAHHDPALAGALLATTTGAHAITLTAPVIESGNFPTAFGYVLQPPAGYTGALTINADRIQGGERGFAIRILGCGPLVINADLYGCDNIGGIGNGIGLRVDAAIPSITIVGDLYGATPGNSGGGSGGGAQILTFAIPTVTITGSFYGAINGYAVSIGSNGTITIDAIDVIVPAGGLGASLNVSGTGAATVRATTIATSGRTAAISNSSTTRILRVSGNTIGGGVLPGSTHPGTFPILGRFNVIDGEPFSLKMVDDSAYPGGSPVNFSAGGGSGTVVTVPGNASDVAVRSVGALFTLTEEDANTLTLGMPADFDDLGDPDLFAAQLNYVFGSEEEELGWLTVTASGVQMYADTADADDEPNHLPMAGTVLFTPGLAKLIKRISTNEILAVTSALASLNGNGELIFDGIEDIRLIAPLWSDLSNTTWKWTATFQPAPGQNWNSFAVSFTGAPGAIVNLGSLVG